MFKWFSTRKRRKKFKSINAQRDLILASFKEKVPFLGQ